MARPKGANLNFTSVPRYEDDELRMTVDESVDPIVLVLHDKFSKINMRISSCKANDLMKMTRGLKKLIEQAEVTEVKEAIAEIKEDLTLNPSKTVSAAAVKATAPKG